MTASAIQVLKEALEKASPGPWKQDVEHIYSLDDELMGREEDSICDDDGFAEANDAAFCVAARNHLPAVLRRLAALEAAGDRLHDAPEVNDDGQEHAEARMAWKALRGGGS